MSRTTGTTANHVDNSCAHCLTELKDGEVVLCALCALKHNRKLILEKLDFLFWQDKTKEQKKFSEKLTERLEEINERIAKLDGSCPECKSKPPATVCKPDCSTRKLDGSRKEEN